MFRALAAMRRATTSSAPGARTAFTLVELLVVLALVGLLVALMLPGLDAAREMGRRALCAANQRQIYAGAVLYAGDEDGRLPGMGGGDPGGPTIHYNQGNVKEFITEYCDRRPDGLGRSVLRGEALQRVKFGTFTGKPLFVAELACKRRLSHPIHNYLRRVSAVSVRQGEPGRTFLFR